MSALFDQAPHVGSVIIHDVDLRTPVAIGGKCDLMAGFGVPCGRNINGLGDSKPPWVLSVPICNINFGVASVTAGCERDFTSIGGICGGYCRTALPVEWIGVAVQWRQHLNVRRAAPKTRESDLIGLGGPCR